MKHGITTFGVLLLLLPAGAVAQGTAGSEPLGGGAPTRQFDELTRLASDRLHQALLLDEEQQRAPRVALVREAERYARGATELEPGSAEGWFLVAASLGLRAHYEPTREKIRMAGEMWSHASTALERDPDHAGAHHVLGRLNLEAMTLSGMARMIATHFYGSTLLRHASWQQAEQHLRSAVALEPEALYHRLWLARLYIERDEEDEAEQLLRAIVAAPADSPLDRIWKKEAAEELEDL